MTSTLALKKSDFEQEVGAFLGWRRGAAAGDPAWSDSQVIKIQMDVASGLRRYYYCGHPWSFMKPMATLTLASGADTVRLPDDFGGIDGGTQCLVLNSSESRVGFLNFTAPGRVQMAFSDDGATGPPRLMAMRPVKAMGAGRMQREELAVYPAADQAYTLMFPYLFTPDYLLDVTQPFAYGGVEHHETILECCLAIAEMRRDNAKGVHDLEAQRLLAISVKIDNRKQPKNLGYNWDHSDRMDGHWSGRGMTTSSGVVINGITYS